MRTPKPLHIEWTDRVIMAPWRYMDQMGNNKHAGWLMNYIGLPETRVLALSTATALALNNNVKEMAFILGFAVYSAALEQFMRHSMPSLINNVMYLDTQPDTQNSIAEEGREFARARDLKTTSSVVKALALGTLSSSMSIILDASALTSACVGVTTALHWATTPLALRYRNSRVAEGHWDLLIGRAPPEPKVETQTAPVLRPNAP